MRDRKKRNIIIGSLCCLLVFMGIGYALLSQTLNINGIANLTGKWKIYIDSITVKEIGGSAKSNTAEVIEDKLTANFDVELLKPGDYVEYDVVVKNEGTINAVLRELIPNIESNNMDILLTHSIIQGQILKAESETKFTLKIRFDERATEIVSGGKTSFDIQMVYEQYDGDASSIDPSLVPVTANDCFTIDENGVITDYDYSCGTYVTVPAVVNGTTVTEISGAAFISADLALYQHINNDSMYYIVENLDAYNKAYDILTSEGLTDEDIKFVLFMNGQEGFPDLTDYEVFMALKFDETSDEGYVLASADIEYLDLSQATDLKKIGNTAFASSESGNVLKYFNVDKTKIEELGLGAIMFANLDSLTITTDMHGLLYNKQTATIDTLRIYPGVSTEISNQSLEESNNEIIVNNLIIGEGITQIGDYAFHGNFWNVNSVKLPDSLIEIGNYSFQRNPITTLDLPSKLKRIGQSAFADAKFTSLVIPSSVTRIEYAAFSGINLSNVRFEENSKLQYIGNYAFSGNKLSSIDFSPIKQKFEIGDYAFYGSTTMKNVVVDNVVLGYQCLPDGLETLELVGNIEFSSTVSNSFGVAKDVKNVIIKSDTLKEIPNKAFYFSGSENTLEFLNEVGNKTNSSIKTIGYAAFMNVHPTTLILPTSLEIIGDFAFQTARPTTLVMSPIIKNIGEQAFRYLVIDSLTIPSSIESIGNMAFDSMPSTSTITVNKAEGSFATDGSWSGKAKVVFQS